MTLLVSGWDIPDFYIYCGFEVKKLLEMLIQYPLLKSLQPILQEGNGEGGSQPRKKKTSNISLFLLAFMMDFHSMF